MLFLAFLSFESPPKARTCLRCLIVDSADSIVGLLKLLLTRDTHRNPTFQVCQVDNYDKTKAFSSMIIDEHRQYSQIKTASVSACCLAIARYDMVMAVFHSANISASTASKLSVLRCGLKNMK